MRVSTILVPVDFSPDSLKAAQFAFEVARRCDARLTLLHVDHLPAFSARMSERVAADVWDVYLSQRSVALRRRLEALSSSLGGAADVALARDHTATAIVRHVADHHLELVVMAPHGIGESGPFLVGGTVSEVAANAACPVLVTRVRASSQLPAGGVFRRPLLAISNEKRAESAANLLAALVERGAKVDLVHVFPPTEAGIGPVLPAEVAESVSQGRRAIRAGLAHTVEVIHGQGFDCSFHIERGTPSRVILEYLAAQQNDLVIAGRNARPGLSGSLGRLAQRLLRHSPVPVLILPGNL